MSLSKSPVIPARSGCAAPAGIEERMGRADETVAADLHERYLGDVFRYVLRRVPRREEAEDITAEVFAAAFAGLAQFRGQCSLYVWLLGIARRQIAIALRRRAGRREMLASELIDEATGSDPLSAARSTTEAPEAALLRAEARDVLRDLVAHLNADQREALLLQMVEHLSVAEIAVVMGRSPGAVYSLLKRARAAIQRRGRAYFESDEVSK